VVAIAFVGFSKHYNTLSFGWGTFFALNRSV